MLAEAPPIRSIRSIRVQKPFRVFPLRIFREFCVTPPNPLRVFPSPEPVKAECRVQARLAMPRPRQVCEANPRALDPLNPISKIKGLNPAGFSPLFFLMRTDLPLKKSSPPPQSATSYSFVRMLLILSVTIGSFHISSIMHPRIMPLLLVERKQSPPLISISVSK